VARRSSERAARAAGAGAGAGGCAACVARLPSAALPGRRASGQRARPALGCIPVGVLASVACIPVGGLGLGIQN